MSNIPLAHDEDYIYLQGGKPTVRQEGKLKVVTHGYENGNGMEVRSHIDYGTVIIDTPKGPRVFDANLIRSIHGEPCETQSRKNGGESYPRKNKEI